MMVQETKTKLRRDAFARRKAAHRLGDDGSAGQNVIRFVADHAEMRVIAGYMPIQTEIDPRPAMQELHALGHKLCLPVITGRDQPLIFREWHPDAQLIEGEFGAKIPASGAELKPDLMLLPLVAFDNHGARLGYGGGYYDRTLAKLRAKADVTALGFAFAAQELRDIPCERTDEPLDGVVTENGINWFQPAHA